jgi:hypothetical protein
VLLDWSEKLSLEPNNSGTGTKYKLVGVLVAVCLQRVGDSIVAETCIGIFDEPNNDVPHTHAFLRRLMAFYAAEAAARSGAVLRHVAFWSDGGQNHFKSGEALAFLTHLRREFESRGGQHMSWNFMQSYHGKGPYDAEGGIVKYRIRRKILEQQFAFEDGYAVYVFASNDPTLTGLGIVSAGIKKDGDLREDAMFAISRRRFFHFPESSITSKWCTSPRFFTGSAKASGELKSKAHVFCLRPALNPEVRVMPTFPVAVGLDAGPATAGGADLTKTPYEAPTLNFLGTSGFGGSWRRFSCCCNFCLRLGGIFACLLAFCSDFGFLSQAHAARFMALSHPHSGWSTNLHESLLHRTPAEQGS